MSNRRGVAKIVRFNWPWYAAAAAVTATALPASALLAQPWSTIAIAGVLLADAWLVLSLVVSHVVYDLSAVARGDWLGEPAAGTVLVCHTGHDEASPALAARWPGVPYLTFDVFDPAHVASPSLRRARAEAMATSGATATAAPLDALPLPDDGAALAVLAFAAHEVRAEAPRVALFRELRRVVGARGRVLVVEHLRDGWNLLAYGPGAFHFLPRRTWLATFAAAGLHVARESRLTPFVARFELRTAA